MFLEPEKLFFLQSLSQACLNFIRLVCKKKSSLMFFAKQSFSKFHKSSLEKNIF